MSRLQCNIRLSLGFDCVLHLSAKGVFIVGNIPVINANNSYEGTR